MSASFGFIIVAVATLTAEEPSSAIAVDLERAVLKHRLAIKSYDVTVDVRRTDGNGEPVPDVYSRWRVWFEGKNLRVDQYVDYAPREIFPGLSETGYWYKRVYSEDRRIDFHGQRLPGTAQRVVEIRTDASEAKKAFKENRRSFDLRSLGLHPGGIAAGEHVGETLADLAKNARHATSYTRNGSAFVEVTVPLSTGYQLAYTYNVDDEPHITRCVATSPDGKLVVDLVLEYSPRLTFDKLLPIKYVRSESLSGSVIEREIGKLSYNSINTQLKPSCFDLAGLEMPVGKVILEIPGDGRRQTWDGAKAVR